MKKTQLKKNSNSPFTSFSKLTKSSEYNKFIASNVKLNSYDKLLVDYIRGIVK